MAQSPNTHCTGVGRNLIPGCGDSFMLSAMKKSGQAKPCVRGRRNSAEAGTRRLGQAGV